MGTRYVTKTVEFEMIDTNGNGYPIEIKATFWYDANTLEITYAYDLQAAKFISEDTLSHANREQLINTLCVHGDYQETEHEYTESEF